MFAYRRSLAEYQLLEEIESGMFLGYVQCDTKVPKKTKLHYANFPPFFRNTLLDRKDFSKSMKQYAEEGGFMCKPPKMIISSFKVKNGTLIILCCCSNWSWNTFVQKKYQFVEYTPKKCFNKSVQ